MRNKGKKIELSALMTMARKKSAPAGEDFFSLLERVLSAVIDAKNEGDECLMLCRPSQTYIRISDDLGKHTHIDVIETEMDGRADTFCWMSIFSGRLRKGFYFGDIETLIKKIKSGGIG